MSRQADLPGAGSAAGSAAEPAPAAETGGETDAHDAPEQVALKAVVMHGLRVRHALDAAVAAGKCAPAQLEELCESVGAIRRQYGCPEAGSVRSAAVGWGDLPTSAPVLSALVSWLRAAVVDVIVDAGAGLGLWSAFLRALAVAYQLPYQVVSLEVAGWQPPPSPFKCACCGDKIERAEDPAAGLTLLPRVGRAGVAHYLREHKRNFPEKRLALLLSWPSPGTDFGCDRDFAVPAVLDFVGPVMYCGDIGFLADRRWAAEDQCETGSATLAFALRAMCKTDQLHEYPPMYPFREGLALLSARRTVAFVRPPPRWGVGLGVGLHGFKAPGEGTYVLAQLAADHPLMRAVSSAGRAEPEVFDIKLSGKGDAKRYAAIRRDAVARTIDCIKISIGPGMPAVCFGRDSAGTAFAAVCEPFECTKVSTALLEEALAAAELRVAAAQQMRYFVRRLWYADGCSCNRCLYEHGERDSHSDGGGHGERDGHGEGDGDGHGEHSEHSAHSEQGAQAP